MEENEIKTGDTAEKVLDNSQEDRSVEVIATILIKAVGLNS